MSKNVLAFDFGASSGRAIVGSFNGEKLTTTETHRFANEPVMLGDTFYWDFLRQFYDIKLGIGKTSNAGFKVIESIGIDTWGVDFGLLDKSGNLLQNPVHYRDTRTQGMMEKVFEKVSKEKIYFETGIQFMELNTIFQLYSLAINNPKLLNDTETLLLMPDLMNYFLTGQKTTEYSIASTTQLLNARSGEWSRDIINGLGLPNNIFTNICNSGDKVGNLTPSIMNELGVKNTAVYTVAAHDTGSAVVAVPAKKGENYAYLSCGTWSLLGLELDEPIINEKTYNLNFTNEGGYGRKIRFLKNIIGLWLMQESRRQWNRDGSNLSFKDIDELTIKAKPFRSFINPDFSEFLTPGDMPNKIAKYCKNTNQLVPEEKGDISRMITESLALKYRKSLEDLEDIKGSSIDVLHIIGGGAQDKLLCQFTANATKKTVTSGPIEATALGNIAVQLISAGEFKDINEARQAIMNSFPSEIYEPQDVNQWDDAYEKYLKILEAE